MTDKNVFDFNRYKPYLLHRLGQQGARSGLRQDLAKALSCQSSFISQVLHKEFHLSLEQACLTNRFFEHDSNESHFFILLVQRERAGNSELRKYFHDQIDGLVKSRSEIKHRIPPNFEITEAQQAQYYSEWDYIAVHMSLAVPELRHPKAIGHALNLPIERVETVLEFLTDTGLAYTDRSDYRIGKLHLHLGQESPFLNQHHRNWRLEILRRLKPLQGERLNYSAVYTLSKDDYKRLKENLLSVIQQNLAVVKPSPEEVVVCQLIDLVPLTAAE